MGTVEAFRTFTVVRAASSRIATAYGPAEESFPHVLVCLRDAEGLRGWGEATPLPDFTGETAETIRSVLEGRLLPTLVGLDCGDIAEAHRRMDAALWGNTAAKAAADMALHDLFARSLGLPLYRVLGGRCRESVGVNRHIGIASVAEAVRLARRYVDEGYGTLKLKVGQDPVQDVGRVKAVRAEVGPGIRLRVDANQGYDLPTALRVLSSLRDEGLEFFEQPLDRRDLDGLRTLRESCGVPIGADESLAGLRDAMTLAERGCADVFVLKLIKFGGLAPALGVAAVAQASGIRCVVTSVFDTQLGAAHCLHLAAALPETLSCDLTCYASQADLAQTCHRLEQGRLYLGQGEGCGVQSLAEVDLDLDRPRPGDC